MDESLMKNVKNYICDILRFPQIDESRISVLNSMEELLSDFKLNKLSEDDFYFLKGEYIFYPPETLEIKLDDFGNFLSIHNRFDEPVYISDSLGKKWSLLQLSGEVLYCHPYLAVPTASYKSEITRAPMLVRNLLLTYELNYISELTLVGVEGIEYIREGEQRIIVPNLKPN